MNNNRKFIQVFVRGREGRRFRLLCLTKNFMHCSKNLSTVLNTPLGALLRN